MKRMGGMILVLGLALFVQVARADWTTSQRLTWNSGASFGQAIAVYSSGNIHVVWHDYTPGKGEIYYRRSTDGGATWLTSQRLTWNSGNSSNPAIAVDSSGNPHIVWMDGTPGNDEIYYKRSTDGGATWLTSQRLTWNSGTSSYPAIAVDSSGNPHTVWGDSTPGNCEIYYKRSTDGGATWLTSQRLTWTAEDSYWPAIAVDSSGNPHILWEDSPGTAEIYYKKSTDGGTTWLKSQRLTWNSGDSYWPAIAVDSSGQLHVVWSDNTIGNAEIYYKKSTNGGDAWMTNQRLTWTSGKSIGADIAVDSSDQLHVVWRDLTPGNYEIYYKKSPDGGSSWGTNQRLTWNTGWSEYPMIAVDSLDNLHVVWDDDTPGTAEIYYKKFIK
jgi:hypothetical protein